jgi:hypothetical protein
MPLDRVRQASAVDGMSLSNIGEKLQVGMDVVMLKSLNKPQQHSSSWLAVKHSMPVQNIECHSTRIAHMAHDLLQVAR